MPNVVVITGGSAGIGRAAARMFAGRGDAVGLIARGEARLEAARAELAALGAPVHVVSADVADPDRVEDAAREIEAALGPITVWINNAMATIYTTVADATEGEIRRVTEVTYGGAVNGTKAALRRMRERGGAIVQVSSVLAYRGIPIQAPYSGAKFALRGFTDGLRAEMLHEKAPVRISMVHLPAVNTPQFGWAANRTGREAKAPDPVYTPETAAAAIVRAADTELRDIWVGRGTPVQIVAARLAPSMIDRYLAAKGFDAQLGPARDGISTSGNLFEPADASVAADGPFPSRARDGRRELVTSRQADGVAASVILLGLVGIASALPRALRPRLFGR